MHAFRDISKYLEIFLNMYLTSIMLAIVVQYSLRIRRSYILSTSQMQNIVSSKYRDCELDTIQTSPMLYSSYVSSLLALIIMVLHVSLSLARLHMYRACWL